MKNPRVEKLLGNCDNVTSKSLASHLSYDFPAIFIDPLLPEVDGKEIHFYDNVNCTVAIPTKNISHDFSSELSAQEYELNETRLMFNRGETYIVRSQTIPEVRLTNTLTQVSLNLPTETFIERNLTVELPGVSEANTVVSIKRVNFNDASQKGLLDNILNLTIDQCNAKQQHSEV